MPGFRFRYRVGGGSPTTERFAPKALVSIAQGDVLNFEDGAVDLAVAGDGDLLGVVTAVDGGRTTPIIEAIVDDDAVYAVEDGFARAVDDWLDLAGPSGAQGVIAGSSRDFTVIAACSDMDETLVRISTARHARARRVGGRLNAALASAAVTLQRELVGRGPTKAQAFFRGEVVVLIMENALTQGERTLVGAGRADVVMDLRREFQAAMRADLEAAVERLTGCRVMAFMSAQHIEPDVAAEIFILDRPVPGERSRHADA